MISGAMLGWGCLLSVGSAFKAEPCLGPFIALLGPLVANSEIQNPIE